MKKLLMILLVLSMVFSLAACKGDEPVSEVVTTPDVQDGEEVTTPEEEVVAADEMISLKLASHNA
ncbi:MAG: hypothetical protein PF505_06360, partial [Vallitaleaceae bacterium]|nr:hypothetical protein [Vallitaleaceae bacterium]